MKSLTLNSGGLTDNGLEILSEALKYNRSVTKVDLSSNKFTDVGFWSLTQSIKTGHTSIQSLKLNFNRLKEKACYNLY